MGDGGHQQWLPKNVVGSVLVATHPPEGLRMEDWIEV